MNSMERDNFKLCNNMLLRIYFHDWCIWTLLLASRLVVNLKLLEFIMNTSPEYCWSSDTNNPTPRSNPCIYCTSNRDYADRFANRLMAKKLRLAIKAPLILIQSPSWGSAATQIYNDLATVNGNNTLNFLSVYK